MLKKSERGGTSVFRERPHSRRRFRYGSVSFLPSSPARAAVVVSKKTCARAPDRARLKRRVYALLRELIRTGRLKKSVIVYPTRDVLLADFEDLRKHISDALA